MCLVFEKVNTGGVILNVFELLATASSFAADAENFSLGTIGRNASNGCTPMECCAALDGDQFLQAVALLKTQEDRRIALNEGRSGPQAPAIGCKKKDILNLSLADYLRWADKAERGFIRRCQVSENPVRFRKKERTVQHSTGAAGCTARGAWRRVEHRDCPRAVGALVLVRRVRRDLRRHGRDTVRVGLG